MTRDEYIAIFEEMRVKQRTLYHNITELYQTHITPIDNNRIDTQCHLSEAEFYGDTVKVQKLQQEIDSYTAEIKRVEIEFEFDKLEEEEKLLSNSIEEMKINAKSELNEYEYWSSSIPSDVELNEYNSKYGFVTSLVFTQDGIVNVYNLNKNFDQDKHAHYIAGIAPYISCNQVVNGEELVQFVFQMNIGCSMAYSKNKKTWYLLMDEDIIFEHENISDVLEYRNIVG